MSRPEEAPALVTQNPDGSLISRIAMEQQLRDKLPTVHERRLLAIDPYGLESKVAYDMKPITVTHWILDQMVARGEIQGDQLGVSSELGADDHPEHFKQFAQRLALFIENGWATTPLKAEGVDMTKYPAAPPVPGAIPPNGQPQQMAFVPPAPPIPGAVAPPPAPGPVAAAPPMAAYPPAAPPMAPQAAPVAPPAPFAAPPAAHVTAPPMAAYPPAAPVTAPPMAAPQAPAAPPVAAPQAAAPATTPGNPGPPPAKADPQRPWNKPSPARTAGQSRPRRNATEQAEDDAYKQWKEACKAAGLKPSQVEAQYGGGAPAAAPPTTAPAAPAAPVAAAPTAPAAPVMPPNPLAMMGGGAPMGAMPAAPISMPGSPAPAPVTASAPAESHQLAEILDNQRDILRRLEIMDAAVAQALRVVYQKPGDATCESVLADFGLPVPQ